VLPEGWTKTRDGPVSPFVFKHADGREQKDDPSKPEGIIAIASAIPDMGAISSVNLLQNEIGIDQTKALVSMLKEHPTLMSLCGNKGNETELGMSGKLKMKSPEDATMLVAEIVDNGALSSANLLGNSIPAEQAQDL
jgi:hypothetical protein